MASAKKAIDIELLLGLIAENDDKKVSSKTDRFINYKNITNLKEEYYKLLPFELTNDQKNAIIDIEKDFYSEKSMNRLLQGDVGSGKTVVAFFGAYTAALSGNQSAIIAPTEILAKQEVAKQQYEIYKTKVKTVIEEHLNILNNEL
jgi:ATP-dependent DNA helicase RecG